MEHETMQTSDQQSNYTPQQVLDKLTDAVIVVDYAGNVSHLNKFACDLLGLRFPSSCYGQSFAEVASTALDLKKCVQENLLASQSNPVSIRIADRYFLIHNSGKDIPEMKEEKFRVVTIRDVTEWKTAEALANDYAKALEKRTKELDEFSYIIAHDLKAPLRAIINLSRWIQEDAGPSLSGESATNFGMLINRAFRLEAMINGILEYSKIGRSHSIPQMIDTYELATEVIESINPPPHISIQLNTKMPVMEGPRIHLFQVFSNLIANAIKYNDKPEGVIQIFGTESKDGYEFSVQDNGPGIPTEFCEKIFKLFQTLHSRDKIESTGIGLTIVKRIIEEYEGKIWVESNPGSGSRFIFHWPRKQYV